MSLKRMTQPLALGAVAALTFAFAQMVQAGGVVVQAPYVAGDTAQVEQVGFKIKKRSVRHHHGFKHRGFKHRGVKRHHSFHHRSFRHHRGIRHHGFVHHPKSRSRIIIKKRF